MLTQIDLQNIDAIVEKRIGEGIGDLITNEIQPLRKDVDGLKVEVHSLRLDVDGLKTDMRSVKRDVHVLKKDMKKVKKDLSGAIRFFDREYLENKTRIDRIEDHLHLPPIS